MSFPSPSNSSLSCDIAVFLHRFQNLDLRELGWYKLGVSCFSSSSPRSPCSTAPPFSSPSSPIPLPFSTSLSPSLSPPLPSSLWRILRIASVSRVLQYSAPQSSLGEVPSGWSVDDSGNFPIFHSRCFSIRHSRQAVALDEFILFSLKLPSPEEVGGEEHAGGRGVGGEMRTEHRVCLMLRFDLFHVPFSQHEFSTRSFPSSFPSTPVSSHLFLLPFSTSSPLLLSRAHGFCQVVFDHALSPPFPIVSTTRPGPPTSSPTSSFPCFSFSPSPLSPCSLGMSACDTTVHCVVKGDEESLLSLQRLAKLFPSASDQKAENSENDKTASDYKSEPVECEETDKNAAHRSSPSSSSSCLRGERAMDRHRHHHHLDCGCAREAPCCCSSESLSGGGSGGEEKRREENENDRREEQENVGAVRHSESEKNGEKKGTAVQTEVGENGDCLDELWKDFIQKHRSIRLPLLLLLRQRWMGRRGDSETGGKGLQREEEGERMKEGISGSSRSCEWEEEWRAGERSNNVEEAASAPPPPSLSRSSRPPFLFSSPFDDIVGLREMEDSKRERANKGIGEGGKEKDSLSSSSSSFIPSSIDERDLVLWLSEERAREKLERRKAKWEVKGEWWQKSAEMRADFLPPQDFFLSFDPAFSPVLSIQTYAVGKGEDEREKRMIGETRGDKVGNGRQQGKHVCILVHGFGGNPSDMNLLRNFLRLQQPDASSLVCLCPEYTQQESSIKEEYNSDDNSGLPFLSHCLAVESVRLMESMFGKRVPEREKEENGVKEEEKGEEARRKGKALIAKISFVGFSLGAVLVRGAVSEPVFYPYVPLLHSFLSLSAPHLGMLFHPSSAARRMMWAAGKVRRGWKKGVMMVKGLWWSRSEASKGDEEEGEKGKGSGKEGEEQVEEKAEGERDSSLLAQLTLTDRGGKERMEASYLMRLAEDTHWLQFKHIVLVASPQDRWIPFHSARLSLCEEPLSNFLRCLGMKHDDPHSLPLSSLLSSLPVLPDFSSSRISRAERKQREKEREAGEMGRMFLLMLARMLLHGAHAELQQQQQGRKREDERDGGIRDGDSSGGGLLKGSVERKVEQEEGKKGKKDKTEFLNEGNGRVRREILTPRVCTITRCDVNFMRERVGTGNNSSSSTVFSSVENLLGNKGHLDLLRDAAFLRLLFWSLWEVME